MTAHIMLFSVSFIVLLLDLLIGSLVLPTSDVFQALAGICESLVLLLLLLLLYYYYYIKQLVTQRMSVEKD